MMTGQGPFGPLPRGRSPRQDIRAPWAASRWWERMADLEARI